MTAFSFNRPLIWQGNPSIRAHCPACGADTEAPFRVESRTVGDDEPVRFYTCASCSSVFPHPFIQPEYDDDYGAEDFARIYTHFWAGIEFMIRPVVAASRLRRIGTLVDIGCGFGYTVDFARRMLGARVLGLDPSPYARAGARALGIDILPRYLTDEPLPGNLKADVMLASEVIEHVEEPTEFLRILRRHLEPAGVVVLTTPDADTIAPEQAPTLVLTALCIGFHRQIFSAPALRHLLSAAGFEHVVIRQTAGRLVALASDQPLGEVNLETSSGHYVTYLEQLASETSPQCRDVRQGAVFRLLEHHVAHGDWVAANAVVQEADGLLRERHGLTFDHPEAIAACLLVATHYSDIPPRLPYWAPFALYFAGMLHLNGKGDAPHARRLFASAHRGLARLIQLDIPADGHFYWQAALHEGIAALVAGDPSAAVDLLDRIVQPDTMPRELAIAECPDHVTVLRAYLQRGVARLRCGSASGAAEDFRRVLADGPGVMTEQEVTTAQTLITSCAADTATA